MLLNEIFLSIQGEGINSGLPTVFIRTQLCNLKCKWCDTKYALGEGGKEMSIEEIVKEVGKYDCKEVYITGGEPLVQEEELSKLVTELCLKDYKIRIATNGSILPTRPKLWASSAGWDIDIKCPSSGEAGKSEELWFYELDAQIKFVVQDQEDLRFTKEILDRHKASQVGKWISPVTDGVNIERKWLQEVAEFCIKENVRYSLQLHKILWGNRKGV